MSKYIYGWDSVNKKKVYMGKYPSANPEGSGYYGRNDAGNKRKKGGGGTPEKREFIGSQIQIYTFFNPKYGTRGIPAKSYKEALRIAESLGYTRYDYRSR